MAHSGSSFGHFFSMVMHLWGEGLYSDQVFKMEGIDGCTDTHVQCTCICTRDVHSHITHSAHANPHTCTYSCMHNTMCTRYTCTCKHKHTHMHMYNK